MKPDELAATHAAAFADTRAWSAAEFADLLSDPKCFVTGSAASFVLMRVIADEAEVLTLATAPADRRKGFARTALQAAEAEATKRGALAVFLEVAEDNTAARALYESLSYRQVGRRAGYYTPKNGAPVAALVLRKEIAAK